MCKSAVVNPEAQNTTPDSASHCALPCFDSISSWVLFKVLAWTSSYTSLPTAENLPDLSPGLSQMLPPGLLPLFLSLNLFV